MLGKLINRRRGSGSASGSSGGSRSNRSSASSRSMMLGQYTVTNTVLGYGADSKVVLATDFAEEEYAIKIIPKKVLSKDAQLQKQFYQEIMIGRKLKHPNVVPIVDLMESKKYYFIVMPLMSGGELFQHIAREGRLGESEARKFFQELIAGVHYLHANGYTHRDLKPENILLDEDQRLHIGDLGTIRDQPDSLLQTVCGTPNYGAPEILMGKGYNGLTADIWSCGVVLYVMLAGRLPFDHEDQHKLEKLIIKGVYPPLLHCSMGARDLVDRLLRVNPIERMPLEYIVQHPWFTVNYNPAMLDLPESTASSSAASTSTDFSEETE
ncbi:Protein tyrosine kinase/Protein kinase domain/Kinase-like, putative [Angomonas deanei]|uniref:Protein tyrosine kinase/Protein kinase domain/Kinase-like, putative n=1 Tax=Angomonas deanei TaxID=59799 RepID=A0A7G2CR35_9TRYP|nr:Protein tyrosine kinase/Protein kinase domain/Kinase-like, putative [Angomonas deanei]